MHFARSVSVSSLPRLFCSPLPLQATKLTGDEARHARVLRLRLGDEVELFDGFGGCVNARLSQVDAAGAEVAPCAPPQVVPWGGPRWRLAVAATGLGARAEWVVEKAAELGIAELLPLVLERSKREPTSSELVRWARLSAAASKQSLRLHSMLLAKPTSLQQLLPEIRACRTLVALQGGLRFSGTSLGAAGGLLVVGPPGDFTAAERDALLDAGAVGVSLGDLRLRTETAAVALVAAVRLSA